ncbi:MAG: GlsB/YeaQ/YmgE family stress response membrane protein [Gemmatimonadota bacterium]
MGLIMAAVFGLIVGVLARVFYPGNQNMSMLKTMLVGIGGGLLAGLLGRMVGWYAPGQGAGIIASVLGAMFVIWIFAKRDEGRTT